MQDTLDILKKADELIEKTEFQSAIDILNEAVRKIEENPILYEVDFPVVYKKLGQCHGLIGDIEEANKFFKEGLTSSTRNLNEIEKTDILASLAYLELDTGNLYDALKYAAKAEDIISEKRGKKLSTARANTFYVLGDIYFREGDIEKAEDYYKKARVIYRKWKLEEQRTSATLDIVRIRIMEGNYIESGLYLSEALLDKIESKCPRILYKYYLVLGKLEVETKQYDSAKENYEKALNSAKNHYGERYIPEIYEAMGDLAVIEGDNVKAKNYYNKALDYYQERNRTPHIERVEIKVKQTEG